MVDKINADVYSESERKFNWRRVGMKKSGFKRTLALILSLCMMLGCFAYATELDAEAAAQGHVHEAESMLDSRDEEPADSEADEPEATEGESAAADESDAQTDEAEAADESLRRYGLALLQAYKFCNALLDHEKPYHQGIPFQSDRYQLEISESKYVQVQTSPYNVPQ